VVWYTIASSCGADKNIGHRASKRLWCSPDSQVDRSTERIDNPVPWI